MTDPIAFFDPQEKGFYWAKPTKITAPTIVDVEPLALYTQRPWVGLTEDEAIELLPAGDWEVDPTLEFAQAIQAKLKEKNT
jgi:hypothetical protein